MEFLISSAWGQAPSGQADPLMSFLPLIVIFVIFYFLLIRPQTKRAKEHRKMVAELKVGDEVVTSGGVLGRVNEIGVLYTAVAGMLNLLAVIDASHRAAQAEAK